MTHRLSLAALILPLAACGASTDLGTRPDPSTFEGAFLASAGANADAAPDVETALTTRSLTVPRAYFTGEGTAFGTAELALNATGDVLTVTLDDGTSVDYGRSGTRFVADESNLGVYGTPYGLFALSDYGGYWTTLEAPLDDLPGGLVSYEGSYFFYNENYLADRKGEFDGPTEEILTLNAAMRVNMDFDSGDLTGFHYIGGLGEDREGTLAPDDFLGTITGQVNGSRFDYDVVFATTDVQGTVSVLGSVLPGGDTAFGVGHGTVEVFGTTYDFLGGADLINGAPVAAE